jgi:hypothetical protein
MGIQPFTKGTLKVIALAILVYTLVYFIPYPAQVRTLPATLLDMAIRSITVAVIFGGGILAWNVSEDISAGFLAGWSFVRSIVFKVK